VGVVGYDLPPGRVARWPEGGYGVPRPYVERLRAAGARTAIVPPGEAGAPEELLAPFDALLLVGGGDVEPTRYGGDAQEPHTYGVEPERDALEILLVRTAEDLRLPILAICRGMQVLNVAYGGTLLQHLPAVPGLGAHGLPLDEGVAMHEVRLAPASLARTSLGAETVRCASHHHQGVDRLGEGLEASGWSEDGLVEAIEAADGAWILGVQWHPEETAAEDPAQQALFDAFVERARRRGD
jgi:putative glutamine amidotransferase